jgi:hypothetical protein
MDIVNIIRKCDSWSQPIDTMAKDGRWAIKVCFDTKEDARAFAVELMMVTSGQDPYGEATPQLPNGHRESGA